MADSNLPVGNVPPLVWSNGRPMMVNYDSLQRDVAGPRLMSTRSIVTGHPSQGLTPARLGQLLIEAEQGDMISYLELAEEIEEKEWQYGSVLGTRKRAVSQLPIEVLAAGDDAESKGDADFIREWLERDTLESELADILDALGKGFSASEIIWDRSSKVWLPDRIEWRDPRWFRFDPVDGRTLQLLTEQGPQPLDPFKYIQHVHPAKSGIPIRGGLARPAAWAWMFKNFALKEWLSFLEAFGMPMRVGRYDNGESEDNIRRLMSAIAQIGSDAAAVFPKTMDVQFIDGKQKGSGGDAGALFKSMAEYVDQQISKLVLGQTGTTDAIAGGHAVGKVHNEVRGDIERADAKQLAATLNRDLIRPMIILNRGKRSKFPRLRIGRPDAVDVSGMASALNILVPLGLKVSEQVVRQRIGLPDPKPGEPVLGGSAEKQPQEHRGASPGPDDAEAAASALLAPSLEPQEHRRAARADVQTDAIDLTADEALDGWLPVMLPMVGPINAALAEATSLEDAKTRLIASLDKMGVEDFAQLLARGTFPARVAAMIEPDA